MATKYLKGQNVNLLIDGTVIAASESCDFSVTANTADGAAKDDANPLWDNPDFTYYDWSGSNSSFIIGTTDLKKLLEKVISDDAEVALQFQSGIAADDAICRKGTAIISSLEIDAPSDDYAKLSLSFEGASELTTGSFTTITPVSALRTKMRGKSLMLAIGLEDGGKIKYHTICSATSHKLSLSVQTADTKTKDSNDKAIAKEVTGKSLTLSTENLINISDSGSSTGITCITAADLLGYATTGTTLELCVGYYDSAVGNAVGDTGDWGGPSGDDDVVLVTGKFLCTSWSESGSNKDNATMSAEFTCQGLPTVAA